MILLQLSTHHSIPHEHIRQALSLAFNVTSSGEQGQLLLLAREPSGSASTQPVSIKPPEEADLLATLAWTLNHQDGSPSSHPIMGHSPPIISLRETIARYAPFIWPVLITGESGTGKELVAHALHALSPRADQPFMRVNCATLPESLAESILFGSAKGAFTGASKDSRGYFETCGAGTLFLDEVGELSPEVQAKLLRVLENREFVRVGETTVRMTSARIVAATNRDLNQAVEEGLFRSDLMYRLNVLNIQTPSLRQCGADRWIWLDHFLNCRDGNSLRPALDIGALQRLANHPFAGNMRELRNFAFRLCTHADRACLSAEDIEPHLPLPVDTSHTERRPHPLQPGFKLDDWLKQIEASVIMSALNQCQHNKTDAARLLGIKRTTLLGKLHALYPLLIMSDTLSDDLPLFF
ncbi:sigma-54 dependent transcriptional regulator [Burkholderiaceae bacterium DAT-1]|nr:sigma-54 dependent transcriptional regulator [Burkholderiaceae bacterium DAT-1]